MTTSGAKPIDITKISEATSDVTCISTIFTGSGGYEATIDELIEFIEDEEDIREGLKALADGEDTITWEQYQRQRAEKESQGENPKGSEYCGDCG